MKILLVCSDSLIGRFILRSILASARKHESELELRIVEERTPYLHLLKRIATRRVSLSHRLDQLAFVFFYFFFQKRRHERVIERRLQHSDPLNADTVVTTVNDHSALDAARLFNPELILVFGVSLLDRNWINLGIPLVNIHSGITPFYRGRFCWFWPSVEGHYDRIGVTIHWVTSGADRGAPLLQQALPADHTPYISVTDLLVETSQLTASLVEELFAKRLWLVPPLDSSNVRDVAPPYSAYFEPGLTQYLSFLNRQRRDRAGSSVKPTISR